jgi:hypothetical protein
VALGLSNREAAKLAGCSHVAIAKAVKTGRLAAQPDGLIDRDTLSAWNEQRAPRRGGNHKPVTTTVTTHPGETPAQAVDRIIAESGIPTHDRPEAERIRANYDALLRQLEYDTKSGMVVAAAEVAAMVGAEYAQVRTKLLAIPAEQAPQIHRLKTVTEVQDALHGMIVEALEGLTRDKKG